MTINRYKIFDAVFKSGSFTKAAGQLHLTQPGITNAINSLETEWGFPLFIRSRTGLELTSEGKHMLKIVRELLQSEERIIQEVNNINGIETGTVKVGVFTSVASFWMPTIIEIFQSRHPNIDIELSHGTYEQIKTRLLDGELDCGFVKIPLSSKRVEVVPLINDRLKCIISKQHRLAHKKIISFEEIKDDPIILPPEGGDIDVKEIFDKYDTEPNIKFRLIDYNSIISFVAKNHGFSIIADMVEIKNPNIHKLHFKENVQRHIGIACHPLKSPATEKFINCVQEWVENREQDL